MNAFLGIAKGLLFVLLASLVVVAVVKWGLFGLIFALLAVILLAVMAVGSDRSRAQNADRSGHDWHEV